MFTKFKPDDFSLTLDPNLSELTFNPGTHAAAFKNHVGQHIHKLITSRFGVAVIIGAVVSAPSRPPVVALEPLLLSEIGELAFTDEMKKLTGRMVRFVVEHLGGRWVRRGIKVSVNSRYRSGSVYSFDYARPARKPGNASQSTGDRSLIGARADQDDGWHNEILGNSVAHNSVQRMAYQDAIARGLTPAEAASLYSTGESE